MIRRLTAVLAVASISAIPQVLADESRYQLEKSGNGFVRLDTRTGEMSICEQVDRQLVCRLAAEERAAFLSEIERLDQSVADLERRIAVLENGGGAAKELPTEEEFERTLGFMERFMRRFMDIIEDFDRGSEDDKTSVDRT